MRLARVAVDGREIVGRIDGSEVVELSGDWAGALRAVTPGGTGLTELETERRHPLSSCELLVPLDPVARGVFCIGLNYREHADEVAGSLGESDGRPPIFMKLGASMLASAKPIVIDKQLSEEVDWEVELGVVLGLGGRRIPVDQVHEHVAGYTVVVDTTARDLQRAHGQWFIGKNSHASSPMGPWVVTVDELGFPPRTELWLRVNGVEKQRSSTDLMIVDIATFISITSESVELRPGDVFATGSPPGVGFTRQPPEFLRPGDVLEASVERVGSLKHAVE